MWLNLDKKEIALLRKNGTRKMRKRLDDRAKHDAEGVAAVEAARGIYATDDVEIDDSDNCVAPAENGKWVMAWVWIAAPEEGEADNG